MFLRMAVLEKLRGLFIESLQLIIAICEERIIKFDTVHHKK